MNHQWKTMLVAACIFTSAAAQKAPEPPISGDVVRIGVLTDMSGPFSDVAGKGSVVAAQLAIDDFGGKVRGRRIELVSADHGNKVDVAASKAREWIDRDGVDMITDLLPSSVAIAVAKVASDRKTPALVVSGATTRLTNEDCTPYTVHWMYDSYSQAVGTAETLLRRGGDTWFFITVDYALGQAIQSDVSDVVSSRGGKVLGSVRHPSNAADYSSFVLQAQASKAKIIGLANAGHDTVNTMKAAAQFGVTRQQKIAGLVMQVNDIHSLGLETAQGMVGTEGFYWDLNEASRAWSKRYFEKMRAMPNMVQAGVYSATLNYLRAVEKVGDDGSAVMSALKGMRISDAVVPEGRIRADGRLMKDMYLVEVKKPTESKYPWDYYKVLATIPPAQAFQPIEKSRCPLLGKDALMR
jgi:branched-chain amino acid transport system substrate-binding protein